MRHDGAGLADLFFLVRAALHYAIINQVMGTFGYAAPDYVQTGHLTTKSDVWSFGVVLYEILTARRSIERNRPRNEQKLLEWVRRHPPESEQFGAIRGGTLCEAPRRRPGSPTAASRSTPGTAPR